jgi:hypothetical protein
MRKNAAHSLLMRLDFPPIKAAVVGDTGLVALLLQKKAAIH